MILTTKVHADMDEVFLRRLHTSAHVPKPEENMRPAVWCSLPDLMCGPLFMIVWFRPGADFRFAAKPWCVPGYAAEYAGYDV